MYASFDALRPGDAVIHYTDSGHTRLVVSVDKANRIVTTLECANWTVPYLKMANPQSAKSEVMRMNETRYFFSTSGVLILDIDIKCFFCVIQ